MIDFNDRTLVLGYTGSGKSELLNAHFSTMRCQRVLVDTKDEWTIPGVEAVSDPEAIDWREPIVHFVGRTGALEEIDGLFAAAYDHRPLVVCVHELGDLCDFVPSRTPPHVNAYLSKGRSHGLGLLGASQRPVEMPKRAKTEAQHVFAFTPRMSPEDVETIARMMDASPRDLGRWLDECHENKGPYSFLWFDRRAREITRWPALPEHVRAKSAINRRGEV